MLLILGFLSMGMYTACSERRITTIREVLFFSDADGDGFHARKDCDDSNSAINPNAREVCDQVDNDCDELIDDEDDNIDISTGELFYIDSDLDGYGDPASPVQSCGSHIGIVANSDDCDDLDSRRHPGASEIHYDGIDQDCDGLNDEVPLHLFILTGQSNMMGVDPNTSFIPRLEQDLAADTIEFVYHAIGSRSIGYWDHHWPYPEKIITTPGSMYNVLITRALRKIDRDLTSVTLVWMQGEADASLGHANVYEDSFLRVLNQFRSDLDFKDINVVIGRINDCCNNHPAYPDWNLIRKIQENLGERNQFDWVNTDDLNPVLDQDEQPYKALHLTPSGYDILGLRFAETALNLLQE